MTDRLDEALARLDKSPHKFVDECVAIIREEVFRLRKDIEMMSYELRGMSRKPWARALRREE